MIPGTTRYTIIGKAALKLSPKNERMALDSILYFNDFAINPLQSYWLKFQIIILDGKFESQGEFSHNWASRGGERICRLQGY